VPAGKIKEEIGVLARLGGISEFGGYFSSTCRCHFS